jgi:hypothetical protein
MTDYERDLQRDSSTFRAVALEQISRHLETLRQFAITCERVKELEDAAVTNQQRIAELELALRHMHTQFRVHNCLNNADCRKCKVLDEADNTLGDK